MRTVITLVAFMVMLTLNAQENQKREQKDPLKPEQIAKLQTKKMELDFDLNDNQKEELYNLNLEMAQKREQNRAEMKELKLENKTLSSDEKYQKKLQQLDDQKKHQTEMKRILGDKNFEIWKENAKNKQMNRQNYMMNRKMMNHEKRNVKNLN